MGFCAENKQKQKLQDFFVSFTNNKFLGFVLLGFGEYWLKIKLRCILSVYLPQLQDDSCPVGEAVSNPNKTAIDRTTRTLHILMIYSFTLFCCIIYVLFNFTFNF